MIELSTQKIQDQLQYLKRFLPRTLLARSVIIIVTPLILLQIVMAYLFYEMHWDAITRRLSSNLAGEISFMIDVIRQTSDAPKIRIMAWEHLGLKTKFIPGDKLILNDHKDHSTLYRQLKGELEAKVGRPFVIDIKPHRSVRIAIQLPEGVLYVVASRKSLFSATTYVFVMWMITTSCLLFWVSWLFMRNQVRPIHQLAKGVDLLGKGQNVAPFKPTGALEVRQAAMAFNRMKDRIGRQISERTDMLAGVSHDLKTPLTRMKLELEFLQDEDIKKGLECDIEEMEQMIKGYLDFARNNQEEETVLIDLSTMIRQIVQQWQKQGRAVSLAENFSNSIFIHGRHQAIRRCLANLIENAVKYAKTCVVFAEESKDQINIMIEDDGVGIAEEAYEDVFKPFIRLEPSRNLTTGGVGLGMTIARDVVRSHGGDILLSRSSMGGLRVHVLLPK